MHYYPGTSIHYGGGRRIQSWLPYLPSTSFSTESPHHYLAIAIAMHRYENSHLPLLMETHSRSSARMNESIGQSTEVHYYDFIPTSETQQAVTGNLFETSSPIHPVMLSGAEVKTCITAQQTSSPGRAVNRPRSRVTYPPSLCLHTPVFPAKTPDTPVLGENLLNGGTVLRQYTVHACD